MGGHYYLRGILTENLDPDVGFNTLAPVKGDDRKKAAEAADLGIMLDVTAFLVAPTIFAYTTSEWEESKRMKGHAACD